MPDLDGVQILLILEKQGFRIDRGRAPGDFSIRPLDRLTSLQKSVLVWHLHTIAEVIHRSLAPFPCTFCGSLAWLAPPKPEESRFWLCGSCGSWGMIRAGFPHPITWSMTRTLH
jgi:hypothetical protein